MTLLILASIARAQSTAEVFEQYASRFKFLGVNELIYDRSEIYLANPQEMKTYLPLLAEFRACQDTTQDILPLLRHRDPKVRLLAIMALYMKEDPHVLPDIAALKGDKAPTYPDPPVDKQRLAGSGIGPPHEPQTVGQAADAVVSFYFRAADLFPGSTDFSKYWAARKDRKLR